MNDWWEDDGRPWPRAVPPVFDECDSGDPVIDVPDRVAWLGCAAAVGWVASVVLLVVSAVVGVVTIVRRLFGLA